MISRICLESIPSAAHSCISGRFRGPGVVGFSCISQRFAFVFALPDTSPPLECFPNVTLFYSCFSGSVFLLGWTISPAVFLWRRCLMPSGRGVSSHRALWHLREARRVFNLLRLHQRFTLKGYRTSSCLRSSRRPLNLIYHRVPLMFLGWCGYFLEEKWAPGTFLLALDFGSPVPSCFPSLNCICLPSAVPLLAIVP